MALVPETPHNKYVMFRNFMMNDLSITREDIREWVREVVTETAQKMVGQMNVDAVIQAAAAKQISQGYSGLKPAIAEAIASKFELVLKK